MVAKIHKFYSIVKDKGELKRKCLPKCWKLAEMLILIKAHLKKLKLAPPVEPDTDEIMEELEEQIEETTL